MTKRKMEYEVTCC